MTYIIGVDIGGTFTDCIVLKSSGAGDDASVVIKIGKASSTPPDFQTGFIESLRAAAAMHGVGLEEMLADAHVYHACTVGTNALVEKKTAKVGLLATRGHADSIFIMKAGGRLKWMPSDYIAHVAMQTKPEPLVSKQLCAEIDERITFDGNALVELNETTARAAILGLLDQGVEAIAISLLWATANDRHERRLRELVREVAPDMFVSISSEVSARVGEYERTIATIVNSMIGPPMRFYLEALEVDLKKHGYTQALQIMSCAGGLIDADFARALPVLTIGSGPVAGLIGSSNLATAAEVGGSRNVITADVGGTTLDIGTIFNGVAVRRATASYGQYEYYAPTLDVRSVGSGGGSIIHTDGETMRVGPRSAGARPGPICYGRGGTQPTVSDAAAVLGYLNPDYFFGGQIDLDVEAARAALEVVGAPLGLSAEQAAAAALRIVDSQMADAIWLTVTQQGYDARDFVLYGFGGAGGLHATAIARELGIKTVVIPLSNLAAGWSAFGISASDALVTASAGIGLNSPFDPAAINERWRALEAQVAERLAAQGVSSDAIELQHRAEIRYALQVNEVDVVVNGGNYDVAAVDCMVDAFESEYERLFGKGSGYAAAGFTLTGLQVHGRARLSGVDFSSVNSGDGAAAGEAAKGMREVIWYGEGAERATTAIFDGPRLAIGSETKGPAILEFPDTTVIVEHGAVARIHPTGSVVITLASNAKD
jgi:N-methylhydantoinase A